MPTQQRLKQLLFQRTAERWAEWWEQNWADCVQDESYAKVNLIVLEDDETIEPIAPNSHFKTGLLISSSPLESVRNPKATQVFFDLDVGRTAALPEKWRDEKDIDSHLDEILRWAIAEGFDLMGMEYESPEGQKIYAIRLLEMRAWELAKDRWKMRSRDFTLEELQAEGREAEMWLLHYHAATKSIVPLEPASFLFITRHGTPGLLFVGVEVQDDSLKPGGRNAGIDVELKPIAFSKGRRFGFTVLEIKP